MAAPQTSLRDETGRVIFRGTQVPGGSSQPGALVVACADVADDIDVATGGLDPLSNGGTINGVTLDEGTRVLLLGQIDQIGNGIWAASAGPWSRPSDFAAGASLSPATLVLATGSPDARSNAGWYQLQNGSDGTLPFVVGTDPITYNATIGIRSPGGFVESFGTTYEADFFSARAAGDNPVGIGGGHLSIVLPGGHFQVVTGGTADPSADTGIAWAEGSLYMRYVAGAGELWVKTGANDTDWTKVTLP